MRRTSPARAPSRPGGSARIPARARRGTWQNDQDLPCARSGRFRPASILPPMTHRLLLAAAFVAVPAAATDVNVIGLFSGKAVVVIDRGAPRTLSVGQRTA